MLMSLTIRITEMSYGEVYKSKALLELVPIWIQKVIRIHQTLYFAESFIKITNIYSGVINYETVTSKLFIWLWQFKTSKRASIFSVIIFKTIFLNIKN